MVDFACVEERSSTDTTRKQFTSAVVAFAVLISLLMAGARSAERAGKESPAVERSGMQIVQAQCARCHQTGVAGAPKIGDRSTWIPRLKGGLDAVIRTAIKGHGSMPARGGLADLTDSELRAAISYMVDAGVASAPNPSPAVAASPGSNHKVVGTTEIYLGVVSAESLRARARSGDAESMMHGGIPTGKDYYHVNISLFDTRTKAEIKDAQVTATISDPITGGESKKLTPIVINNAMSYGNYFRISGSEPRTITVSLRRPDSPRAVEARFDMRNR